MNDYFAVLAMGTVCLTMITLVLRTNKKMRDAHTDFFNLLDWAVAIVSLIAIVAGFIRFGWMALGFLPLGLVLAGFILAVSWVVIVTRRAQPPMEPVTTSIRQDSTPGPATPDGSDAGENDIRP